MRIGLSRSSQPVLLQQVAIHGQRWGLAAVVALVFTLLSAWIAVVARYWD